MLFPPGVLLKQETATPKGSRFLFLVHYVLLQTPQKNLKTSQALRKPLTACE